MRNFVIIKVCIYMFTQWFHVLYMHTYLILAHNTSAHALLYIVVCEISKRVVSLYDGNLSTSFGKEDEHVCVNLLCVRNFGARDCICVPQLLCFLVLYSFSLCIINMTRMESTGD